MGTLDPIMIVLLEEKAISVAEGIAHPFIVKDYDSLYKHKLMLGQAYLQQQQRW